ncbi:zinc ribbon domain-containing protein [Streptomyces coeruleoprunus]|uniref:Zinc ribbon domain-containing protein n=1 Tax=Streptomyces coeruleoprunus TaxID=285563 RepID=A0ABV9X9E7_9ACTN
MADARVCPACHTPVAEGSLFCPRCGRSLTGGPAPPPPGFPPPGEPHGRPGGGGWSPRAEHDPYGGRGPAPPPPDRPPPPGPPHGAPHGRPGPAAQPLVGGGVVEGQVRGVQVRSEMRGDQGSQAIWTFRVERYDEAGNRLSLVPVEMRGMTFEGSISDGDWIRAEGRMRHGTLRVTTLQNLTTGAVVRAKGVPKAAVVAVAVIALVILAGIAWIAYTGFTADTGPPPGFLPPPR